MTWTSFDALPSQVPTRRWPTTGRRLYCTVVRMCVCALSTVAAPGDRYLSVISQYCSAALSTEAQQAGRTIARRHSYVRPARSSYSYLLTAVRRWACASHAVLTNSGRAGATVAPPPFSPTFGQPLAVAAAAAVFAVS